MAQPKDNRVVFILLSIYRMESFCPVLPVSCFSVCFLVLGSLSSFSHFIYTQSLGSCLTMLPLWDAVCTEKRTVKAQWGLGSCVLQPAWSQFSFPPHPTVSSAAAWKNTGSQPWNRPLIQSMNYHMGRVSFLFQMLLTSYL